MSHNLKALGLALAAVFALSAFASSAASATEATFTSGSNWTVLTASAVAIQVFQFENPGEKVVCTSVSADNVTMGTDQSAITAGYTFGKTLPDKATEAEATTTECTIIIGAVARPVTIHAQGCDYTFTAGNKTEGEIHINGTNEPAETCETKGTVYLLGEFRPCIEVHDQTPTQPKVEYINGTYLTGGVNHWDVRVKSEVKGITYKRTGICRGMNSEESNNAEYLGEVTVKGANTEGAPVDITWDQET